MDHILEQSARLLRLCNLAQEVRQVAINRAGDLEGWRVSRLLRDASTPAQADEAERQFRIWELALSGDISMHLSTFTARETQEG
jgi:hypothetical protein